MKYPGNIAGPHFENGDLIHFIFDGSELTLRLPVVPANKYNEDSLSPTRDFRGIDTQNWDTDNQERPAITLAEQAWSFEDSESFDDIATCKLYITLVEAPEDLITQNSFLHAESFEATMVSWLMHFFADHEEQYLKDSNWPALANRYHAKSLQKEHLNWFKIEACLREGTLPRPMAMIPINNRFVMITFMTIDSVNYSDRKNPYGDKLLREFEFNLFDEFLSHIDLRYTPETIATIQTCENKSSH